MKHIRLMLSRVLLGAAENGGLGKSGKAVATTQMPDDGGFMLRNTKQTGRKGFCICVHETEEVAIFRSVPFKVLIFKVMLSSKGS